MSADARARLNAQGTGSPQVIISSRRPGLRVVALLDTAHPKISGGYGGWEVVARPRDKAFTEWRGVEPARMSLPIILDGFMGDRDQEPFIRNLERMGRPDPQAGDQPPIVRVQGAVPAAFAALWVIDGLEWGDNIIRRPSDGHRVRADVIVSLLEHVTADIAFSRSAAQRRALNRPKVRIVTAKRGDTMAILAKRLLRDVGRWTEIRNLNPGLGADARKAIKAGTRVRVPAS